MKALWAAALFALATIGNAAQPAPDATKLLQEADRLAWLRAWSAAEPLFTQAQKLFAAQGDQRNALYAEISAFRGQLPRTSVPAASTRLEEYLQHPLVQSDDRLRLRVLVIKGETDEDLDPTLAGQSWREALAVAEKLGDAAWANRAKGELGLVAFLQGDVGGSVIGLGQAVKVAQSNGDVSSLVRWLTLFGLGYVQLGRPQEALDFYDRALKAAAAVPELQFSVMTYVGKSNVLIKLGRVEEAETILAKATEISSKLQARGYQAQLLTQRALIANQQKQPDRALALLGQATALAKAAGGKLKRLPLADYQVLHFAVHGIPSTKFPARAALLVHPSAADDGVLQAREILMLRLNATLVTLSACDTGSGSVHGQDGAASLVRPFIASGARTVVANLWAADDTFSLALMREFYRRLAAGTDISEALRDAKLHMLKSFGPQAVPRLWSGVLAYGDGRGVIARRPEATASRDE